MDGSDPAADGKIKFDDVGEEEDDFDNSEEDESDNYEAMHR